MVWVLPQRADDRRASARRAHPASRPRSQSRDCDRVDRFLAQDLSDGLGRRLADNVDAGAGAGGPDAVEDCVLHLLDVKPRVARRPRNGRQHVHATAVANDQDVGRRGLFGQVDGVGNGTLASMNESVVDPRTQASVLRTESALSQRIGRRAAVRASSRGGTSTVPSCGQASPVAILLTAIQIVARLARPTGSMPSPPTGASAWSRVPGRT